MSTSSIKPVPTLKGIFSVPKMNHRRDFLRENKLNLRELQRVTTNKNKSSQQQEQQKQSKHQQLYQQQQQQQYQQQLNANRRSASQQRIQPQKQLTRSISQQRPSVELTQARQPSRCSSVCSVNNGRGDVLRRSSNSTVASKAESCDKQIQTEDINDEEFLYRALKRCTASEFNGHSSTKLHLNDIHHKQTHSDPNMPYHSSFINDPEDYHNDVFQAQTQQQTHNQQYQQQQQQQQPNQHQQLHYQHQQQQNPNQHLQQHHQQHYNQQQQTQHHQHQQQHHQEADRNAQQDTQRTRNSYNFNNNNHNNDNEAYNNSARITTTRSQHSHMNGHQQAKTETEDVDLNLDNLAIEDNQCVQQQQQQISSQQQPLSGRSRLTIGSTRSQEIPLTKKKSNGSLHKFGSRDDVRLPRYLEREKREKEEQRMREMVRDPNCPLGHFVLTDDERLAALATAQKKFQSLINELNHMPMTTQTLRIRTRKAEIEKELAVLEADIRIFSKSKVYIKKPEEAEN